MSTTGILGPSVGRSWSLEKECTGVLRVGTSSGSHSSMREGIAESRAALLARQGGTSRAAGDAAAAAGGSNVGDMARIFMHSSAKADVGADSVLSHDAWPPRSPTGSNGGDSPTRQPPLWPPLTS